MGVVIETHFWEPSSFLYLFLFAACFLSIFLLPHFSNTSTRNATYLDSTPASFSRFQRRFLLVYSLASVVGGLQSVFGEFEYGYYGISKDQMVMALSLGCFAALLISPILSISSDMIGHKKVCILFCLLHVVVGLLKSVIRHPNIWVSNICLALASSVFSFSFESWMVVEHEKLGYRQELLIETFWLMTFSESASLVGTQALANLLVSKNAEKGIVFSSASAAVLAMICIIYVKRGWSRPTSIIGSYKMAFSTHILRDKRIWLLVWAQACLHFSAEVFWILWAPIIVADGREVRLAMIYPCLLGGRMLGSTAVPWFLNDGPLQAPVEYLLTGTLSTASLAMFVVAYDYQEIGFLVALFCIFHTCIGLSQPSLARLRSLYVPNELRAGMMGLSLVLANAAIIFVLSQGGYNRSLSNSAIISLSAVGLLTAACSIHLLKRWMKPHQEWHKL